MKIEEAIELLQERHMTVSMCMSSQDCTKQNAALDMAITALRENAEREKGCALCTTGAHRILQNALYCPRCGKRLEVEP